MKKILIIGQAPPAQPQEVPYDTTLLYIMLQWVGITKEQAQEIFIFDALTDKFPGYDANGGHLKPTLEEKLRYYESSLKQKVIDARAVILLGNEARDFLLPIHKQYGVTVHQEKHYLFLPHPSKRNHALIHNSKDSITRHLGKLLIETTFGKPCQINT